ncbi:aldehyde ferredoxin oxidoreductase N-terminal domain-containing protein [Desulfurispora thermophila]|uniref:aldehyde ferredoxin oxidoreductase N-terminal domain-containing protein n=1 Tax=Desulfurispora thermophila TaxID=265470 RepID=UPI00037C8238|nr:aldehyde ferredoxin oxidoreductase C-terminal domain-containing protein [Desulfurispora thermophila]
MNGPKLRVLQIDLTERRVGVLPADGLEHYLGGIGLAAKLFAGLVDVQAAPLDAHQPVVLAGGALAAFFPMCTKGVAVFRSPLTGGWGESYAGMRLALALRLAGWDAIVITGRADRPVYLSIGPHGVRFKSAAALWGLDCEEAGRLLRQLEPGRGFRSCLRIGPAGEKGVAFASVNVDTYRHFGRLGLGAVLGAKNLKAIVIYGDRDYPVPQPKQYREIYDQIYRQAVRTDVMEKYHALGTSVNVSVLSELGALPTRNLQQSTFEAAERISGRAFAEGSLVRKVACAGCPVGCIHIGLRRRQFAPGYEYESVALSYDHELIYALGSLLGMSSPEKVYDLIEAVELYGLDAISAGVLLAWLTEAQQNGLLREEDLGCWLEFDRVEGYLKVLENLVEQPSELYALLAQGLARAVERLGGKEYALCLGGHEMAGYHTGPANLLGLAVGARHSHLDNAGYAIDQKASKNGWDSARMVHEIMAEEKWRNVLNCLCICLFAREVYTPAVVQKALAAVGIERTGEELMALGEEIFQLKNRLRSQLGYSSERLYFAPRYFATPALGRQIDPAQLQEMLELYRQQAGV